MPSSSIIKCVPIKNVRPHPNADNLLIIDIMAWQVITHKDTNPQVGEFRIYIPPDSILPEELAVELDVKKYLKAGNRVGQVKLRGELSFGLAIENKWGFAKGEEVADKLGIVRYEPPEDLRAEDQAPDHPLFPNYARVENFRNFPEAFNPNEYVYLHEKIDGTNSKVGLIREDSGDLIYMIGSHSTRRKLSIEKPGLYQYPLDIVRVLLMKTIQELKARSVIAYGEIYGKVQKLRYGLNNDYGYRMFDLCVDGTFLDWGILESLVSNFEKVHLVPLIYKGPITPTLEWLNQFAEGKTLLMDEKTAHIREGVVIRPAFERTFDGGRRLILKYRSNAYEELKARGRVDR